MMNDNDRQKRDEFRGYSFPLIPLDSLGLLQKTIGKQKIGCQDRLALFYPSLSHCRFALADTEAFRQ
jgi:hypothetical protein